MTHRLEPGLALAAIIALAGCDAGVPVAPTASQAPQAPPAPNAPATTPGAPIPPAGPRSAWAVAADDQGSRATWSDGEGVRLRMACAGSPRVLSVVAERLTPIGSEERLTIGVGNEAFGLVARPGERPVGVAASAPVEAGFVDHLSRGGEIGVSYGAQTFTAPPMPDPAAFAAGCRQG